MPKTCYICGAPATSREHAPAQSYFPEDPALRVNLITVHSCQQHNEDTSKDDEYVRNIIVMSMGGNSVAFQQFFDKTIESFKQSPGLFITTTQNSRQVYTNEGGAIKPTYAFQIERERFERVVKKIAYALFYKTFKSTWNRELIVMTEFLRQENMQPDEFGALIQNFRALIFEHQFDGNNPQVFKFKFFPTDSTDNNDQVLRMVFYEGFEIWITTVNGSSGPHL